MEHGIMFSTKHSNGGGELVALGLLLLSKTVHMAHSPLPRPRPLCPIAAYDLFFGLIYCRSTHLRSQPTNRKSGSFRSGAVRPLLLNVAVGVWGVRLASYLFARIIKTGGIAGKPAGGHRSPAQHGLYRVRMANATAKNNCRASNMRWLVRAYTSIRKRTLSLYMASSNCVVLL